MGEEYSEVKLANQSLSFRPSPSNAQIVSQRGPSPNPPVPALEAEPSEELPNRPSYDPLAILGTFDDAPPELGNWGGGEMAAPLPPIVEGNNNGGVDENGVNMDDLLGQ